VVRRGTSGEGEKRAEVDFAGFGASLSHFTRQDAFACAGARLDCGILAIIKGPGPPGMDSLDNR